MINFGTSCGGCLAYGTSPYVKISYNSTPNDQTSLFVVKFPYKIASGLKKLKIVIKINKNLEN